MTDCKKHYYWLDWLRFGAALLVLLVHARGGTWVEWGRLDPADRTWFMFSAFTLTRLGLEAVVTFFVLSGFLVGGKALERTLAGSFGLRAYAVDRFTRIWIPLIPALLLTWGVAVIRGGAPPSALQYLGNLAGLQGTLCNSVPGNPPLWSLAYEIWFYLLAGSVAIILLPGTGRRAAFTGCVLIIVCFAVFTKLKAVYLFCWLLGAVSYLGAPWLSRRLVALAGVPVAIVGCILAELTTETVSLDKSAIRAWLPSNDVAVLIVAAGLSMIVPLVSRAKPGSPLAVGVERRGSFLAAFSYTLYLTHYPLLMLWAHFSPERSPAITPSSLLVFLSKVGCSLVIAWLIYLPFEAQTGRVRRWLGSLSDSSKVSRALHSVL